MDQSTAQNHWKNVLFAQGRSLKWLAAATETPRRTVYSYSCGQRPAPKAWLDKVSVALGKEVEG